MPPKGSKKDKGHPYKGPTKKSSRQVNKAKQTQPQPSTSQDPGQPPRPRNGGRLDPPTGEPQGLQQVIDTPNINNSQPPQQEEPVQPQGGVSRQEFMDLKATMQSMKDTFSSFMSNFMGMNHQPVTTGNSNDTPVITSQPRPSTSQVFPAPPVPSISNDPVVIPAQAEGSSYRQSNDQVVDGVVNQAMSAHVNSILSPPTQGKESNQQVSYQIDRRVSPSLIQDIWDEKFVEMISLLDKTEESQAMTFKTTKPGEPVTLVPIKTKNQITSIDQWSKAFNVFTSVYTRKYIHQTHNLLTYADSIRDLANQGGDYLRYDREFRLARSRYAIPWEVPENIMWTACMHSGLQTQISQIMANVTKPSAPHQPFLPPPGELPPPLPPSISTGKLQHPPGYCYTYHNRGRCGKSPCRFSHMCWTPGCNQEHSVYTCPLQPDSVKRMVKPKPSTPQSGPKNPTSTDSGKSK